MNHYTYPFRDLAPDYARAAAGFAVTAGPLPWLTESPVALLILGGLGAAFAAYGVSTWFRQRTTVQVDAQGIASEGLRRVSVPWESLELLDLRYYSTRRDRQKGWMQLRLSGGGRRVTIDSALDGFVEVARRAAAVAAARDMDLDPVTEDNLRALGIEPHRRRAAERGPA